MCGIFGYSIKRGTPLVTDHQLGILSFLLGLFNDKRGGDSWGFAGVDCSGKVAVIKGMKHIKDTAFNIPRFRTVMAHTRYATIGAVNKDNAHPFQIGRILGAHNGMIYNHFELDKKYNRDFDVDSMHLIAHLNDGLSFSDIEGYGALEWMEHSPGDRHPIPEIHLCRLSYSGDLNVYGIGEHGGKIDGVVWSSQEDHLKEALRTAGIRKTFKYEISTHQVYTVRDTGLYYDSYKLELGERKYSNYNQSRYTRGLNNFDNDWNKHGGAYSHVYGGGNGHHNSRFNDDDWGSYYNGNSKSDTKELTAKKEDTDKIVIGPSDIKKDQDNNKPVVITNGCVTANACSTERPEDPRGLIPMIG